MSGHGHKQALVLAGGGAWGAYQLGVLRALIDNEVPGVSHFDPEIFTGTSVGSFNASYLASHWDARGSVALDDLKDVWFQQIVETRCGNAAFRIRLDPIRMFNPYCFFANPVGTVTNFFSDSAYVGKDAMQRLVRFATSNAESLPERVGNLINLSTFVSPEPWERLIRDNVDFDAIRQSDLSLSIIATNWNKGKPRVFDNQTVSVEAIRGSSAIPGFYPGQDIEAEEYVDGGVLMNTPLKPAIRAGAQELHVIDMTAPITQLPLLKPPSFLETFFRQTLVGWVYGLDRDISRVGSYNKALTILKACEKHKVFENDGRVEDVLDELKFTPSFKDIILVYSIHEKQAKRESGGIEKKDYCKLTVHNYQPREPMGGLLSLLNMERKSLEEHEIRGYENAVSHNCETAGCILANSQL